MNWCERRAEYERQYGKYEGKPQPQRTATNLRIEIHPAQRAGDDARQLPPRQPRRGADRLHASGAGFLCEDARDVRSPGHEWSWTTKSSATPFTRWTSRLQPGDSLTLNFDVQFEPRGFRNGGSAPAERAWRSSRTAPTSRAVHCRSSATSHCASSGVRMTGASTACRGSSRCPRLVTSIRMWRRALRRHSKRSSAPTTIR